LICTTFIEHLLSFTYSYHIYRNSKLIRAAF
jgi:hypothetical protein